MERADLAQASIRSRYYEMSFLLPHFLKEGRGKIDVYFTRVYNPVWTNPDGFIGSRCCATRRRSACTPR